MKNYYLILGVDPAATLEQIKAAYRRQAKELHPDYYGRDSAPFLDLQEAYAVLSDPGRRRLYDEMREKPSPRRSRSRPAPSEPLYSDRPPAPEPLIPEQEPADLGDLSLSRSFQTFGPSFEELFERLWRNFDLVQPEAEPLQSLTVEIRISPQEALHGGRVRLMIPGLLRCSTCHGRGHIGFYECWRCGGEGMLPGEYPLNLEFPPGIVNNHQVEIPLSQFGINNFYLRVIFRVGTP